jgi:hypothetical protein
MTARESKGLSLHRHVQESKPVSESAHGIRHGNASKAAHGHALGAAMVFYRGLPVELNDRVEIALSPSVSVRGSVVWVNGDNCGVAFETPDHIPETARSAAKNRLEATDARASARRAPPRESDARPPCAAPGKASADAQARPGAAFVPGLQVKVLLGGGRERRAVVRWSRNNIAELFIPDEGTC